MLFVGAMILYRLNKYRLSKLIKTSLDYTLIQTIFLTIEKQTLLKISSYQVLFLTKLIECIGEWDTS